MSNLMAGFGPDFVETQILSETNSVTYRITAKATHPNAVPNQYEFTLNQKAVGTPPSVGINVWRINNAVVDPIKPSHYRMIIQQLQTKRLLNIWMLNLLGCI